MWFKVERVNKNKDTNVLVQTIFVQNTAKHH